MTMYDSGFHWNLKGDRWNLFSPSGQVAATVYLYKNPNGHCWHVWDEDGCGGENSLEPTIEQAKITAESAVLRWGRHFRTDDQPPHCRAAERGEGEGMSKIHKKLKHIKESLGRIGQKRATVRLGFFEESFTLEEIQALIDMTKPPTNEE